MKTKLLIIFTIGIIGFVGIPNSDAFNGGGIVIEVPGQTMDISQNVISPGETMFVNGSFKQPVGDFTANIFKKYEDSRKLVLTLNPTTSESGDFNFDFAIPEYWEVGNYYMILENGSQFMDWDFAVRKNYVGASLDPIVYPDQRNLSPLKQFKSEVPIKEIQCKEDLQLFIKNNGMPACVKSDTASSLFQRQWGMPHEFLVKLVENSDAIITGMVVGEDNRPNGERHIWLGSYEWLKQGKYEDEQLFLEQTMTRSGNGFYVPFERGEEVLLFLKNVDVRRGAYDLVDSVEVPAQKHSIKLRDAVAAFFDHEFFDQNINNYEINEDYCSEKFLADDLYYYCTTKSESHVPIEKLAEKIKEKMLEKISSGYYEEHFDLKVISDQPDVVFEPGPNSGPRIITTKASGQNIEFVYTIDDVNFNYFMRTEFDKKQNQMYLHYHPPREILSIVSTEDEINELIYSCLEKEMYKFPYRPFHVAYHAGDGISPVIEGHGPPTVYDRWGDAPVQDREKIFRVWLATGKVDCTDVHQEFYPENKKRPEKIILFDSAQLGKLD